MINYVLLKILKLLMIMQERSRDKTLFYSIHRLNHFPINFKITKYDWRIYVKNRKENVKPQT